MSDIIKPAAVLLIICVVAAALLGYVNHITTAPIAEQSAKAKAESISAVLPEGEPSEEIAFELDENAANTVNVIVGDSVLDTIELAEGQEFNITSVTPVKTNGETSGYAIAITTKGFSAGLELMFGVDTTGTITGLSVVNCSNETPGLGANAANESFYSQFADKAGDIKVDKDGGEIVSLTGATITSRAVANAAAEASAFVTDNDISAWEGGAN